MAQVRNVSPDTVVIPLLNNRSVEPGELVDIPDEDIWPAGLAADSAEGLQYAQDHPNARVWPAAVWQDVAAPPPVPAPVVEPPAPSE